VGVEKGDGIREGRRESGEVWGRVTKLAGEGRGCRYRAWTPSVLALALLLRSRAIECT
jgi:hypothetical protein